MFKKSFYLLFIFCFSLVSFQIAEAKNFNLKKDHWTENHYDAKVFNYNGNICTAGPYGNEIRTSCAIPGGDEWLDLAFLIDEGAEYIGLDDVLVWKDHLYYFVDRGTSSSNNDTSDGIEVWRLVDDGWSRVFSFKNRNAYLIDMTNTEKRLYIFIRRYNTKPLNIYYSTKDGVNWSQAKSKNIPDGLQGMTTLNNTIYGYTSSALYKRKSNNKWKAVYTAPSSDEESTSLVGLTSFKGKLYAPVSHYTYVAGATNNASEYTFSYKIMSSKKGVKWSTKKLTDKALKGTETSTFYNSGNQLWLFAHHYGKARDLLWRIPKNVRKIGSKNKKIVPKTRYMRVNSYYLRDFVKSGKEFYFKDSHGNIYKKK